MTNEEHVYKTFIENVARIGEGDRDWIHIIDTDQGPLYKGERGFRVYTRTGFCIDLKKQAIYVNGAFVQFKYSMQVVWGVGLLDRLGELIQQLEKM